MNLLSSRERSFHWNYFASDLVITAPDGNPLQIVEYHGPSAWRTAGTRALHGDEQRDGDREE